MFSKTLQWFRGWHVCSQMMLVILLLNIVDFLTTASLVWRFGYGIEVNPVLRSMMEYFDTAWVMLWFKLALFGIAWAAIMRFLQNPKANVTYVKRALWFIIACFTALCFWNFFVISQT